MDQPVVGACGDCLGLCNSPKCRLGYRKPVSEAFGAVKCAGIIANLRLDLPHRLGYGEHHPVLMKSARIFLSPTPDDTEVPLVDHLILDVLSADNKRIGRMSFSLRNKTK
jgi:hypothetical protein